MHPHADEMLLTGGNVSASVVRVGQTVRRPSSPTTAAVNSFLLHLERAGFDHAPRYLGTDDSDRQMLSWVPGVPQYDIGPMTDDQLERIGAVIRRFHDASATFVAPPDANWERLIPADSEDLIVHHDLAPWNLIVQGEAMTFIDWDGCAPGSRLWDLAYAVHGFAVNDVTAHAEAAGTRLARLVDGYGLDAANRKALVPMLARRTRSMYDLLADGDRTGAQPWARLFAEGHGVHWNAVTHYLQDHEMTWAAALGVS